MSDSRGKVKGGKIFEGQMRKCEGQMGKYEGQMGKCDVMRRVEEKALVELGRVVKTI